MLTCGNAGWYAQRVPVRRCGCEKDPGRPIDPTGQARDRPSGARANFGFIPHYPLWSILIIVLDAAIIWALASYRRDAV